MKLVLCAGLLLSLSAATVAPKIEAPEVLFFDGKPEISVPVKVSGLGQGRNFKVKLLVRATDLGVNEVIRWQSAAWCFARGAASGSLENTWKTVATSKDGSEMFYGVIKLTPVGFGDNLVAIPVEWKVEVEK